jgi:hypothetical protein
VPNHHPSVLSLAGRKLPQDPQLDGKQRLFSGSLWILWAIRSGALYARTIAHDVYLSPKRSIDEGRSEYHPSRIIGRCALLPSNHLGERLGREDLYLLNLRWFSK